MIGYLRGTLIEVGSDHLLVLVGGEVGYEVQVNSRWLGDLWGQTEKEIQLWIYTHVREDALQLFGFDSKAQKNLFLSLLKVSGIGPRLALSILSGGSTDEIIQIIERGDSQRLSKFPRVGKKTAEQMVLTLQGKLVRVDEAALRFKGPQKEIAFALKNLGFKELLVNEFIDQLSESISVEEGVRQGLQALSHTRGE